ncbi:MAG: type II toxin-antitoxin system VapC family toxin [Spirochaetaceae bacterium]|nr:type II toxin-antitoxin system VapC family toxin [Spirochaetaceae bacterium]
MKLYIDSSVLVKLYYPEPESKQFSEWIIKQKQPILFTQFHELEMVNAFALKVFRNEISEENFNAFQGIIKKDKGVGILEVINPDWSEVLQEAIKISKLNSSVIGTRSLDIIHVASADILNCDTFLTNDKRQLSAALAMGFNALRVENIPDYL